MSENDKKVNRRQMLKAVGCGGAALFLGGCAANRGAYDVSDGTKTLCPYGMINDPYPGKCLAYRDDDGDGICDCSLVTIAQVDSSTEVSSNTETLNMDFIPACPHGYKYDPYPGHCSRYVDTTGSGYCDLSEPQAVVEELAAAIQEEETVDTGEDHSAETENIAVACPFGIVNDPYPGQCGRYIDTDGSGYCDYSEVQIDIDASEVGVITDNSDIGDGLDRDFIPTCPYGYMYDPYPGRCHKYVDTDGSGYCDHSEPLGGPTGSGQGGGRHGRGNGDG